MEMPRLSHSLRNKYKECPRKVYFQYVAGIEPKAETGIARAIGTNFHVSLEMLRKGDKSLKQCVQAGVDMLAGDLIDLKVAGHESMKCIAQLEAYLVGYLAHFGNQAVHNWAIEIKIESGADKGYVDAIFQHEDGKTWVIEDKTTSIFSGDQEAALVLDDQLLTYAVMLDDLGHDVGGFIYRQTKKTRTYPRKDETIEQYRDRLVEEYTTNHEKYYRQFEVKFSQQDIHSYRDEKNEINNRIEIDFIRSKGLQSWNRNSQACIGKFGTCDYLGLCSGQTTEAYKPTEKGPLDYGKFRQEKGIAHP